MLERTTLLVSVAPAVPTTCRPAIWFDTSVSASSWDGVSSTRKPVSASVIVAWTSCEAPEPGASTMPSHWPMPPADSNTTGSAAVPSTVSLPTTRSSHSDTSVPDMVASLVAKRTVTPLWISRNAPDGTVTSPITR